VIFGSIVAAECLMLKSYGAAFARPGAGRLSAAGFVARFSIRRVSDRPGVDRFGQQR